MEQEGQRKKGLSKAMVFLLLFGFVSLFSDMTHEGASSIRGAYLDILGASAGTIGFISGLGELVGYSMRYFFGKLTDKTKHYWTMVIVGYVIDILAVPCLALVGENGWIYACMLLIIQRMGKAIKKPAKDTILSFVASQEGAGKSFGIQELLDQIGAFLGPVLLYYVMLSKTSGTTFERYSYCFKVLLIPSIITIALLLFTKYKFPNPDQFEVVKEEGPKEFHMEKRFLYYIIGISLFAFGFLDYSLVVMHVSRTYVGVASSVVQANSLVTMETLPLLYALAMIIDAFAALFFGYMFDRKGVGSLVLATILSAPFVFFVFGSNDFKWVIFGVILWGIGMGAQESILKAAVSKIVPKNYRATGYGIFEFSFGVFWFLGSWALGVLYEKNRLAMMLVSFIAQLAAIPYYILAGKQKDACLK